MSVQYTDLCENCRKAESVWKFSKRIFNDCLKRNKIAEAECQTKVLAILYCTIAESYYLKILYTPNSLSESEIQEVKDTTKFHGISKGWEKCLDIALKKCQAAPKGSHIPNVKQTVERLIKAYILDPSLIRNKFAHGQWSNALNSEQTKLNSEVTTKIQKLDVSEIEKCKYALTKLAQIMTDILASPNKAHMRDFWKLICELEEELDKRREWTFVSKKEKLKKIPAPLKLRKR
ncbi:hypothetical protein [uncultured Fibrobacter sp.]|uniref:hypothetical protein n=1 Tax=uncultured Fibrobacter sp. TaxID=261512 RepID=UPI0026162306|nr:hypothetical protein [uncultured Fibrobacter sp.]